MVNMEVFFLLKYNCHYFLDMLVSLFKEYFSGSPYNTMLVPV